MISWRHVTVTSEQKSEKREKERGGRERERETEREREREGRVSNEQHEVLSMRAVKVSACFNPTDF